MAIPTFIRVLQVLAVVLPVVCALIAWKVCKDLSGADELEAKEKIKRSQRRATAEGGQPA